METIKTADLWDRFEHRLQVAEPVFRNYGGREAFAGEAVCVSVFEDNVLVKQTLQTDGGGKVLVVDGGGSLKCALVGDIMAGMAVDNHWSGLVVYGCIRDAKEVGAMPIGLKALNTSPRKSAKNGAGTVGEPLQIAGVTVRPGDRVYADSDGIVIAGPDLFPG
jgi:regulator of ribonuclease activity A